MRILAGTSSLAQAGDRLIDAANEAGGRDNITVVLFRLEDAGGAPATDEPTVIGMAPTRGAPAERGDGAGRGDGAQRASSAIMTVPPPTVGQRRPSPRLARTQGRPDGSPARRRRSSERSSRPCRR